MLENTAKLYQEITVEHLITTLQNSHRGTIKKREEHYNTVSAFIKSMRASQPNAALYYLARMVRCRRRSSLYCTTDGHLRFEDVGLADPQALTIANDVFRAVEIIGYPELQLI